MKDIIIILKRYEQIKFKQNKKIHIKIPSIFNLNLKVIKFKINIKNKLKIIKFIK